MTDKRTLQEPPKAVLETKKRKKLTESGPLTQNDVALFQKEAIYRQLLHYKKQVEILDSELRESNHQLEIFGDKFTVINEWIDQFIDFVNSIVGVDDKAIDVLITPLESKEETTDKLEAKKVLIEKVLSKISQNIPSDVLINLSELNKQIHELKAEKSQILNKHNFLQNEYDDVKLKYLSLIKDTERANSRSVQRVNPRKEEIKKEENFDSTDSKVDNDVEKKQNGSSSITQDQFDELNNLVNEQKTVIEKQDSIIQENLHKLETLGNEIITLQRSNKDSDDVRNSPEFLSLLKDYETLNIQHNEYSQNHDALIEKFRNLEQSSNLLNDFFGKKHEAEKKQVVDQYEKLETDLIRIRTSRDELLARVSVLESEKNTPQTIEELKQSLESQQKSIEELQLIRVTESQTDDESVEALQKKNSILTSELQSLEKAYKSLQSTSYTKFNKVLEFESHLSKYKIEKQKADQKYFAAMRSKDALIQEIKTLKDLNKTLETKLTNLEEAKQFSSQEFQNLENKITALNKLTNLKQREIDQLSKSLIRDEAKLKSLSSKNEELTKSVQSKSAEVSKLTKSEVQLKVINSKQESTIETLNKNLTKYKSHTSEAINQEELEQYRSLIYCTLCSKNWKDTAITKCGHVFCHECTQKRLDARMRKCPSCNQPFSQNDIISVHL